jgi:hypothetical protein
VISLREILDKRWSVLSKYMAEHLVKKKKDLLERLLRLNRIRNCVMHPVRKSVLSEEDFEFVRDLDTELADFEALLRNEAATAEPESAATPGAQELVSKLATASDQHPAPEQALTAEQAQNSADFIPSTRE